MATKKRVAAEARPLASKKEVMAAFMSGGLTGLFMARRVSQEMAEEILGQAKGLLGDIPDDDPRIKPLVRHIEREKRDHKSRRAGKTVKYKAQRNKQRRTAFIHLPLDIFGDDVDAVEASFEVQSGPNGKPRIVVVRS